MIKKKRPAQAINKRNGNYSVKLNRKGTGLWRFIIQNTFHHCVEASPYKYATQRLAKIDGDARRKHWKAQ